MRRAEREAKREMLGSFSVSQSIIKYLRDQNIEDTSKFAIGNNENGQPVFAHWDYDIPPPDLSNADETAMRDDFSMTHIRKIRNDILDITDRFVLADSPIPNRMQVQIIYPYRQSLRDLTTAIRNKTVPAPELDDSCNVLNLSDIFPVVPTIQGNYLKIVIARYRWMRYAGNYSAATPATPATPATETPASETPATPASETPATETPATETPATPATPTSETKKVRPSQRT